jgi:biotin carboxyl carrier protein
VSVDVAIGDPVELGGRLLVIEAMKMQNELSASAAGKVAEVNVRAGDTVERAELLLRFEDSVNAAASPPPPATNA